MEITYGRSKALGVAISTFETLPGLGPRLGGPRLAADRAYRGGVRSGLTGARARPHAPGARPRGLGAPPPRRHRQASPAPGERTSCHPLPAGAGPRRGVGHAPAPGALPPRPRDAVWRDWPAGAGPHRVVHGQRDVPRYGDDVLAA